MLYRLYFKVDKKDILYNLRPFVMGTNELSDKTYLVHKDDLLNFVDFILHDLSTQTKEKSVSISFVDELIDVGASDSHLWDGNENIVFTLNKKKDKVTYHISSICWDEDKLRKLHFMDTNRLSTLLNRLSSKVSLIDEKSFISYTVKEEKEVSFPSILDSVDLNSMTDGEFISFINSFGLTDVEFDEIGDEELDSEFLGGEIGECDDSSDENVSDFKESTDEKEDVEEDCNDNIEITDNKEVIEDEFNGEIDITEPVGGQVLEVKSDNYRKTNLKGLDLSGKLISFEGGEGSGKTSQIKRLAWDLEQNGYGVLSLREPGGSKIAEEIREVILKKENKDMCTRCESLCFAAARAQLMEEVIEPALKDGKVVILDRYVDSSYVYQGLVKDAGLENIALINDFATNRRYTDLTIYIDVSPDEGFRRIEVNNRETNKFEEVDISFHEMVRENYKSLAKKYNNRIVELDGEKSMNTVYKSITNVLKSKFKPVI